MFQIRGEQMEVFQQAALANFEDEMVAHSRTFSPWLCGILGDEPLRLAVRAAITRAMGYGFTNRGPIRLFIEMTLLFGSAFDSDPQYPWAARILCAPCEQMDRAEDLFHEILTYQREVFGPGSINVPPALEKLANLAQNAANISSTLFVADMLRELSSAFPGKAQYIGHEQLAKLIAEGCAEARANCLLSVRSEVLMAVLMFAFGRGCAHDPFYPWIAATLHDSNIVDPAARAERLKKKAVIWLEHLKNTSGGAA